MIKFLDLESIINIPQMPQKIVIKFKTDVFENGVLKGFDYYIVTINVPSFTKCAKIYGLLIENIKRASFLKAE